MQIIPDNLVLYLQLKVLGTLFSAITYGIVAVLSGNCFYLLQRKRGVNSNRIRIILLIYVAVMLLLSTLTLFQSICQIVGFMFPPEILPAGLMYLPITLTLTIWGENGFMIWRCVVSYQDASNRPRILTTVLLSLLSLVSLGCGVMVLVNKNLASSTAFILLSLLVNIILTTLIVSRLIYRRRHFQNLLGEEHGSPYINIMTMCVESSALVVLFSGIYTALTFAQRRSDAYWALIPFQVLPHIFVISPILIVYRIVMGRAITPTLRPSEQVKAQIRFKIPTPSQGLIQTFPYSMTSTTRQRPQVSPDSSTKVLESEAGLVGNYLEDMSESGLPQPHPSQ